MDLSVAKPIEPRDYRKGNWTIEETMILIEAKKMDDERRMKRLGDGADRAKPAELRWKWVEDYCWKHQCFRSQNQCNDKWDNLMRDFKKVREYETRVAAADGGGGSYWRIDKSERKERNLPSNMLPQIYQALVAVTERKGVRSGGAGTSSGGVAEMPPVIRYPPGVAVGPPPPPAAAEMPTIAFTQPLPTATVARSDTETSHEYSGSPAKRRKRREREGTSGGAGGTSVEEVGSAISRSASIIAEAIQSSEERGERRHKEMVNLHERRLRIEESKAEINRQGVHSLADAINKLANSILALAANTTTDQHPPPTQPK